MFVLLLPSNANIKDFNNHFVLNTTDKSITVMSRRKCTDFSKKHDVKLLTETGITDIEIATSNMIEQPKIVLKGVYKIKSVEPCRLKFLYIGKNTHFVYSLGVDKEYFELAHSKNSYKLKDIRSFSGDELNMSILCKIKNFNRTISLITSENMQDICSDDITENVLPYLVGDLKNIQKILGFSLFSINTLFKDRLNGINIDLSSINFEDCVYFNQFFLTLICHKLVYPKLDLKNIRYFRDIRSRYNHCNIMDFRNCYNDLVDRERFVTLFNRTDTENNLDNSIFMIVINKECQNLKSSIIRDAIMNDINITIMKLDRDNIDIDSYYAKLILLNKKGAYLLEV